MADDATAPPPPADAPVADVAPSAEGSTAADRLLHWIDLTLGAWRPREAASQLACRLGVDLGPGLPDDVQLSPVTVGLRAIDIDAIGDPVALQCHDDARRIADALPAAATVAVLAPRYGLPLGTFNDWFLHFLRRFAVSLVLLGDEPATVMARSAFERRKDMTAPSPGIALGSARPDQQATLRFFPGLLPRAIMERAGIEPERFALIPVGDDRYVIPPAYRDLDPLSAAARIDTMEELEAHDVGFAAFGQSFCTAHFADSERLSRLARGAFHSGEIDLARSLATRARNVARTPDAAAAADLIRQEIRLYQRRFNEIVANAEPSRRAPARIRDRLSAYRLRAEIESGSPDKHPAGLQAVIDRLDAGAADSEDLDLLCRHVARRVAIEAGDSTAALPVHDGGAGPLRSEERRVGKECRSRWSPYH